MSVNNEVKIYVKNIKKRLLYNTKESKQYLKNLETNIMEYVDEFQVTDMASIKSHFGSEEEIANAFLETIDIRTIKRKIKIKHSVIFFVVAMTILWFIGVTLSVAEGKKENLSYEVQYAVENESNSKYTL